MYFDLPGLILRRMAHFIHVAVVVDLPRNVQLRSCLYPEEFCALRTACLRGMQQKN